MKICFASSSGGHFEELMMLTPLIKKYDSFILTERTNYEPAEVAQKVYYLPQINRKEIAFLLKLFWISLQSLVVFLREQPDLIICTGVLAVVPMCCIAKIFRKKLIYIETFAKTSSPTRSGRFLSKFADRVYVQWEEMKKFYPEAFYVGGIY